MKSFLIALLFCLLKVTVYGQVCYSGKIANSPIELMATIYPDEEVYAMYVYTKYDSPISIKGSLKNGVLTLKEADSTGRLKATLVFVNFDTKKKDITGIWKDVYSKKELKITLKKTLDIDLLEKVNSNDVELLQSKSLIDKYFKVVLKFDSVDISATVSGVKIFEKGTDKLLQQFALNCNFHDFSSVAVEDYNFDGHPDFSVFETFYGGPNTSSIYFLYNPQTGLFFKSTFEGVSLFFNQSEKIISEHNQSNAGNYHMKATYKVVNNQMVLIEKKCQKYDESIEDFKDVECE